MMKLGVFQKKNQRGFTLIEVMIGVALLASMSVLMYSTVNRSLSSKEYVEKKNEGVHGVRVILDKMIRDVNQAFMANVVFRGAQGEFQTGFKGQESFMEFSTMSHYHYLPNEKDSDQVVVGYRLESNDKSLYKLMRRESNRLTKNLDEGGKEFDVLDNIKKLELKYYDANKKEWVNDWDSTSLSALGKLPEAVQINITVAELADDESDTIKKEISFSTVAMIGMYQNEINF